MGYSGTIHVRTENTILDKDFVRPYEVLPGRFVKVSIADTGTGISPENLGKLFEPLFTTKAQGVGLGLTISKKLIEANGGRIAVESQPGTGTAFTLHLPVCEGKS